MPWAIIAHRDGHDSGPSMDWIGLSWVGLRRVGSIFFNNVLGEVGFGQIYIIACYCAYYVTTLKFSSLVVLVRRAGLQTQKL